jgi:diguanylate cyclase (GGDEF)-like protein
LANREPELRRMNWWPAARLVMSGTLACVGFSFLLNYLLFSGEDINPLTRSLVAAVVTSLVVAAPLFSFVAAKLEEIRSLKQELNHLAMFDRVTSCITGTAFSAFVGSSLGLERRKLSQHNHGALLVIDVEQLNRINARFGHSWGDEALRLIASVIRSSIRSSDVVGRVGSSEFGVFLPGASEDNAVEVGERIRAAVANAYFAPQGIEDTLKVSVGGIVYQDRVDFNEMFRIAEQQMQRAKIGSGQVELSHLSPRASGANGYRQPN